jgi:uncharacterized SAM-binding protein YcdF (DUF218 family)
MSTLKASETVMRTVRTFTPASSLEEVACYKASALVIGRRTALLWVVAGLALELCWLFACESWREREPGLLAVVVALPGTLEALSWQAVLRPVGMRRALVGAGILAAVLVSVDVGLDAISPFARRWSYPEWELARVASLGAGFVAGAWLAGRGPSPRWRTAAARIVCAASLVLALLVPGAMIYLAIDGSRDGGEPADAALVLGFALAADGSPRPQIIGRVEHAVALYKQGRVKRLILSGGAGKAGHTEAGVMRDLALAAGVPADALILEEASRSTIENFACSRPVLDQLAAHRVLLVTEPWHMTRAMLLAHRHGLYPAQSPASSAVWRSVREGGFWLFRDAVAYLRERVRNLYAEPGRCNARECEGCRTF